MGWIEDEQQDDKFKSKYVIIKYNDESTHPSYKADNVRLNGNDMLAMVNPN